MFLILVHPLQENSLIKLLHKGGKMKGRKTISRWLLRILLIFFMIIGTKVLPREVMASPTLDSDLDGWRMVEVSTGVPGVPIGSNNEIHNVAEGGNPGGYARSVDESGASTPRRLEFFPYQVLMLQGPGGGNF